MRPSRRRWSASFAEFVVLPEPWSPVIRITVGGRPKASCESPVPISSASRSWTSLTTCWPALRPLRMSSPSASAFTPATKSLTTWKLTSASSSARRISRIALLTASSSSRLARPRSPRVAWSRSERASNTAVKCTGGTRTPARPSRSARGRGRYRLRELLHGRAQGLNGPDRQRAAADAADHVHVRGEQVVQRLEPVGERLLHALAPQTASRSLRSTKLSAA